MTAIQAVQHETFVKSRESEPSELYNARILSTNVSKKLPSLLMVHMHHKHLRHGFDTMSPIKRRFLTCQPNC